MRRLPFLVIVFFLALAAKGQTYGNGWINFSQRYHKFPIFKEGIYRLDSATLAQYYNLATINPKNFQIFLKGKEQRLYIQGEADNQINTGDYIEFYASTYQGDIDSLVYNDITYVPNPYNPLFNDTLYAFITLNTSFTNNRYVLETDTNAAAYPTSDYFYHEQVYLYPSSYNSVDEFSQTSDPRYTQAEGFGIPFDKGTSVTTGFSSLNTYTASAKNFYVTLNYSGNSLRANSLPDHQIETYYSDQNNNPVLLSDTSFWGYKPVRKTYVLNSQNTNNNTNITLNSVAAPQFSNFDNSTLLHYVHFFYPHTLDLNSQSAYRLYLDNGSSSAKSFFNFSNFNSGSTNTALLYDITNGKRISTVVNGSYLRAVVPNASGRKLCYLTAESQVISVANLSPVEQTGTFTNYKTITAAKPYVIIYNSKLKTSALAYKNYRESFSGGSYNVIFTDIQHLYEQYSYGINKHPLAIKNFAHYLKDSLAVAPHYIFLIGKGVNSYTLATGVYQGVNLIPTFGLPSSDNLLTAALSQTNTNTLAPEIPIGRLAATTDSQVSTYLAKVMEQESTGMEDWKKRILHFVGGDDEQLASKLASYMSAYEQTAKDSLFGAEVITFKKNTTAPIQINISDSIKNTLSAGAALVNFFGHGSEQGFDQAIDDPQQYNNKGKYPVIIANSCYSGDIHVPTRTSVSESFVFAKDKGSIAFIAAIDYGYDYALNNYSSHFYTAFSRTHYNQGIGDIVKEAAYRNSLLNGDPLSQFIGAEMTLHGDPAIKLSNNLLPDYQITNSDVSFDLKKYTDSLGIFIRYKNPAKAIKDSFSIRIERYFPNGDSTLILAKTTSPMFKDSFKVYTAIDFNRGFGLNKFKVKLDYLERINEVNENNNSTLGTVDMFIPGGDILPVYPYKFAVVPKTNSITLKASTTDPFAPATNYRFQLDTCDKFTSVLSSTLMTSKGGVLEWTVNLPFKDSTVYFWRVSRDSVSASKPFAWRESSFQTITGKRGWGQAQFDQFKSNTYQFVNYKKAERQFIFQNTKHSIKCRTGIHPFLHLSAFNYFFDTQMKEGWSSSFNGWNFAVFDSVSGLPQETRSLNYPASGLGPFNNCVEYGSRYVYSFGAINPKCGSQPNWKTDMENFLNSIAPNNYVLAYSTGLSGPNYSELTSYSSSLYAAFESIGAKNISTTSDTVPYILFGRKGMTAGQAHTTIGPKKSSILNQEDSITTAWHNGYVVSELIGPSSKWNSLHWRVKDLESTGGDTSILKLIGVRANGQLDTLKILTQDSLDVMGLSTYVDANVYPYLKLAAFMYDNVHRTSPQLKRWQVLYDEAPDCAINPLKGFASINDTLLEGDEVTFRFPIENISDKNFTDSLVITYWIENNDRVKIPLNQKMKAPPFKAGTVLIDTVIINSYQLKGNNALWIFVNPIQNPNYQAEQFQFNNIGRYAFKVDKDITNPLLDVTFDGVRILNGDLVSARPNILITLKDENRFLALNDTSAFTIFLQSPGQTQQQRIYFGENLQFTPASLPKNSCSIHYNPAFYADGKYTLIVQARDRSRNVSGSQDYRVQFEIATKPSVTQVLNYPNPFSTSTRFVFTLTGSEVPEVFTIQIMTISGKIVREITRAELGNLHIGRNITDFAWDGRDTYGDRLANGVYLYRVITKLNGDNIEKNASGADKFFVKDFGKMVLMR